MKLNVVGAFIRNYPFGTEIAFGKGLRKIGVEVNEIDPGYPGQVFDKDADATLLFKWIDDGDYRRHLQTCKGPKIVYQPDDYRFSHIKDMMREMRNVCDFALTYDDEAAQNIKADLQYKLTKKMLLTADPDLYRNIPDTKKKFDVCFVGSLTGGANHRSRARMIDILSNIGFKVACGSDIYNIEEIVTAYNSSTVVLNHATDIGQPFGMGWGYQCRHFEAGFTGACLVSNSVYNDENGLKNFYRFNDEWSLVNTVEWLLKNPHFAYAAGSRFKAELDLNHRPEHRAQEIIEFVESCKKCV